jgi:hypothetical protein
MPWTEREMQLLGNARASVRSLENLIEEMDSLPEAVYQKVFGDDGEVIDKAISMKRKVQSEIKTLEQIKLKEYNEGHGGPT